MKYLSTTFPSPPHNLACDEALLELAEEGYPHEILRVWESSRYFVVLGSSNRVHQEVHVDACEADGIPILRRHSGGGTVLQGPGCLNFSLILRIDTSGPTRNITETTRFIMRRHAELLSTLLGGKVEMQGSSDLALAGRKFSGNAQRRKLKALLFHGTFLLDARLDLIEKYLRLPPKQPEYRRGRSHREFLCTIGVPAAVMTEELKRVWDTGAPLEEDVSERIAELVEQKYARREWNFKM